MHGLIPREFTPRSLYSACAVFSLNLLHEVFRQVLRHFWYALVIAPQRVSICILVMNIVID